MAVITNTIRFADNAKELAANIQQGIGTLDVMKVAVDRTVESLGGGGLFGAANRAAVAIQQMGGELGIAGGVMKLSSSEQERFNALMEKAAEKAAALGTTIPPAWQEIEAATRKAETATASWQTKLSSLQGTAQSIGMGLSALLTAPLIGMGAAALKSSIDFETAFAGVKKTVSGTPAELEQINAGFREMAKVTPASAVELAKIGEMAGQLGVQKEKVLGFTKTIVDISSATNLTADEAGSAFARLANVMKMPQDQFSNLGSAVVALGNFGASTEQEMLSMGQRIAAAGSTAGMSAAQILGIANALSSVGIEAESGGTAMSRVINKISMDVANGGGKLDTFAKISGKSAKDFSIAWKQDAGVAFSDFMQGLAQARSRGGDELLGLMHELGFDANVRLVNAFMSAANAGDLMKDSIALGTKAFAENTEITRASEERYKTTANQLKVLWNNLTDVAITIGNALTPSLNDAVIAIKPMVGFVADLAKGFAELPGPMQMTALGVAGVVAALGPLLLVGSGVIGLVLKVSALLTAFPAIGAAAAGAVEAVTTGMIGMVAVAAGVTALAAAVGGLAYGLTRLADVASGGKLSGWLTPLIAGGADLKKTEQELGAVQDSMALAFERTGIHAKTAAEALQLNTAWSKEHAKAAAAAAAAQTAFIGPVQQSTVSVKTLADKVHDLTEAQKADIISKYDQKESQKAISAETGIAADVVAMFIRQQHASTAAGKAAAAAAIEYASAGEDYAATVDLMSGAVVEGIKWDLARGISQKSIAEMYGVTVNQIKAVIETEKEHATFVSLVRSIEKTALAESLKEYDNWAKAVSKSADDVGKHIVDGAVEIGAVRKQIADLSAKEGLSSYDYEIVKIQEWASTAKGAFKGTGEQAVEFYSLIDAEAKLKIDAIGSDWQVLRTNSTSSLQQTADKAAATYDYMAEHASEFSAETIEKFRQVAKATQDAADGNKHEWINSFVAIGQAIPQLVQQAFTGGGGVAGAARAGGSLVGSELGKGLVKNLTHDAPEFMGSALGQVFGAAIPAIGALAGPLISAIIKLFDHLGDDIARDAGQKFGTKFSDATTKAITDNVKSGMTEVAAELSSLSSIISDAGGLNGKNLPTFTARLHDVFSMIQTGQLTVAQGGKILNDNWATFAAAGTDAVGLVSKSLTDLIALDDKFGTHTQAIADFVKGQLSNAAAGLQTGLTVSSDALKSYDELNAKQMDLRAQMAATSDSKTLEGLQQQLDDTMRQLNIAGPLYDITRVKSQDTAAAIAASITGIVSANMQAGMSFIDAVRAAGPSVDALQAQLTATGFSGGAAFDFIKGEVALANDAIAGPALKSVEGFTAGLVGLSNAGVLDQDTFAGLANQIGGTEQALVAQGYSSAQVMLAMRGDLQTVWEAQQKYGYKVDDTTQSLIDQGVQSGLIGESGKSDNQKILDVLMAIGKVLGADLPNALGTFQGATQNAASDAGKALTDLSGKLVGKDPASIQKAIDEVTDQLQNHLPEMTDLGVKAAQLKLHDLTLALADIKAPPVVIPISWGDPGPMPGGGGDSGGPSFASMGGLVTALGVQRFSVLGMAGGGIVPNLGMPSVSWPTMGSDIVPASLTPGERVLSVEQNQNYEKLAKGASQAPMSVGGSGWNGQSTDMAGVELRLDRLERAITRDLPKSLARASRDANQGPRRR